MTGAFGDQVDEQMEACALCCSVFWAAVVDRRNQARFK
jgi:hypothetical protein